ncbi:MAG: hypothetical protein H6R15_4419 [Proteobacteria bacterium]|nr:hypothetical protein [Pseudomonadota bacterium]
MSRSLRLFLALLAVLASALAQADPPARVGRLAVIENGVNFRIDRADQGGPASINWPIGSGALLETERRGRAEVWVGSTAFRLAANSQLEFPVLDDQQVSVQLLAGSLAVSILDSEQSGEVTVDTPEGRISFATPGRYRIDVLVDHSELTAQAGRASFSDAQQEIAVTAGQKARLYGGGRMRVDSDLDQDAFDNWVAERENAALASTARRYVSPAMTGYQDLDRYGDWNTLPDYGAVWYPRTLADDWAPYRDGRWAWVAPWGWTWVDQAPWGFAPFHYGRWIHVHNRWGWVPGTYVARPVYAPALVAWIGNPGWSVTFRSGAAPAVGWFPLAPHEVYVPGFHASPEYVRRLNRTHVRDLSLVDRALHSGPHRPYANRALPQAVTIVPARQLSEGRPIRPGEIARHDRRELERAPQARGIPDNVVQPPVRRNEWRDDRRDGAQLRGREPDAQARQAGMPPAAVEPPRRDATPLPLPNREDARRGAFGREPATPLPAVGERQPPAGRPGNDGRDERRPARDNFPARSAETPRADVERRLPPVPVAGPRSAEPLAVPAAAGEPMPPAGRPGNAGRDERRPSRDNFPARSAETPRVDAERRLPAVPVAGPRAVEPLAVPAAAGERQAPAGRPGSDGRDERRPSRDNFPARSAETPRTDAERRLPPVPVAEPRAAAPLAVPAAGEPMPPAGRPGNEGRDQWQSSRDGFPARRADMPRADPERRSLSMPQPAPLGREAEAVRRAPEVVPALPPAGFRPGSEGRDERRSVISRETPPAPPAPPVLREMPRPPEVAPRPREMPQAVPPPVRQVPVAPPPPPPPAPAPRLEPPRPPAPQVQAPPPAQPQQRGGNGERRREPGDERGR